MGTVICHPLDPRSSAPVEVITDITQQCHHCVTTCLPGLIVGHHTERYKRHRSSNIPSSDSAYVLALNQPKIAVSEGYLESQRGAKVASTPENRPRDENFVPDRRGSSVGGSYDTQKPNNIPTGSYSSCPLNGQTTTQGGLTIVRRSNSRKGNLAYQGATTPTSDQPLQSISDQTAANSCTISRINDQQESSFITFSDITTAASSITTAVTTTTTSAAANSRTIDQLQFCKETEQSTALNQQLLSSLPPQISLQKAGDNKNSTIFSLSGDTIIGSSTSAIMSGDNGAVAQQQTTGLSTPSSSYGGEIDFDKIDLATETLPAVDTPDACDKAAIRLRCLLRLLQRGEISAEVLQKNLHYAARVLEAVFIDETNQDNVTTAPTTTTETKVLTATATNKPITTTATATTTTTVTLTTNCNNSSNNKLINFNKNNNNSCSASSNNNINTKNIVCNSTVNSNNKNISSCCQSDAQHAINNLTTATINAGRTKGISTAPQTHSGPTGPPTFTTTTTTTITPTKTATILQQSSSLTKSIDECPTVSKINQNCSGGVDSVSNIDGNNLGLGNKIVGSNNGGGGSNVGVGGGEVTNKTTVQRRRLRAPVWAKSSSSNKIRLADEDDELSEVQPDAVPPEVREWLASTFTRQLATTRKRSDEKPKFRSVAHAIRAGIFVDRIYRRVSSSALMQFPPDVVKVLKTLDDWSFDVFALAEAANGQPVKYLGYDLLNRYGIIHKFKIPPATLEIFLNRIEEGYCRFHNPYHNNLHAADVTQTTHHILCQTGLMNWLTDLEIFATLLAALIHDFEHTGTTNNFHVMSGSETAMLYNDRAVLENHHISAAFRVLKDDDANILAHLSREEYRELRTLIIDMVLSTDMSFHFQQLKNMKNLLTLDSPTVDKSKALSLVLHCCDISHPAKRWSLHHRWTMLLLEEFFRQGDLERELGLPFSPLCDRNNTLVAESQIGFIDFIVDPSMTVCSDMLEYILAPITPIGSNNNNNTTKSVDAGDGDNSSSGGGSVKKITSLVNKCESISEDVELAKSDSVTTTTNPDLDGNKQKFRIRKPWNTTLAENKKIWKEQAVKDAEARAAAAALNESEENNDNTAIATTTTSNDKHD